MVAHAYNPSAGEAVAGRLRVKGQPRLHRLCLKTSRAVPFILSGRVLAKKVKGPEAQSPALQNTYIYTYIICNNRLCKL
jgi:hypothetical protein